MVGQTYSLNNSFLELDTTITTEQMGKGRSLAIQKVSSLQSMFTCGITEKA